MDDKSVTIQPPLSGDEDPQLRFSDCLIQSSWLDDLRTWYP